MHSTRHLAVLQEDTRSGSPLYVAFLVCQNQRLQMRPSQQALDRVVDENGSAGPTHSSIRTGVQGGTSLSTKRAPRHGLFLSQRTPFPPARLRERTGGPGNSRATSKQCLQHLTSQRLCRVFALLLKPSHLTHPAAGLDPKSPKEQL